ncbi:MAG: methyltransferase domain-containing protein [Bacteroidales bacterium]|nr:methyltransferase domain-containing protein [Bacteroidales bacterium]HOY38642.1 class I SAM-dependent methyltransferase [Bacteroidales bacterium]HQP05146.1 class I SAM-dependent methyltransferase [Bacteroidales bacterium]
MVPSNLLKLYKVFGRQPFALLDAGSGNFSASKIKRHMPQCNYYGIDITRDYNYRPDDFELMQGFWLKDLTQLQFDDIPDNTFDALLMTHIIEHLHNGDQVIQGLLKKLKKGGYVYIEYPSEKSVNFPSKKGTLNFYDDPTHVRLYSLHEVKSIVSKCNFEIIDSGTRKSFRNIAMMPIKMVHNKIKYGYVMASVYWDWYGFAEFVWAQKK